MIDRAAARRMVSDAVALPLLTTALADRGFRYQRGPMRFVRENPRSVQELHLGLDLRPRYAPGSLLVLQPQLRIEYSETSGLTAREGSPGTGVAVLQPIAFGRHDGGREQWDVHEEEEIAAVGSNLAGEINERILPLLDDLIEPEGLVAAYEIRDGRVSWHIQAVSSVIAFLLTSARTAEARVVASEWFRGSSLDVQFPKLSERLRRDE